MYFHTSVLPNVPVACILSNGFIVAACRLGLCLTSMFSFAEVGGFPIKVSLSQDGSSSDKASRNQEDLRYIFVNK